MTSRRRRLTNFFLLPYEDCAKWAREKQLTAACLEAASLASWSVSKALRQWLVEVQKQQPSSSRTDT